MEYVVATLAFTLPLLCSLWAFDKVYEARGIAAFRNPGGWKFPLGEVVAFAGMLVGLLLAGLTLWLYTS